MFKFPNNIILVRTNNNTIKDHFYIVERERIDEDDEKTQR